MPGMAVNFAKLLDPVAACREWPTPTAPFYAVVVGGSQKVPLSAHSDRFAKNSKSVAEGH